MNRDSTAEIEPYNFAGRQGDYIDLIAPSIKQNLHSLFSDCILEEESEE